MQHLHSQLEAIGKFDGLYQGLVTVCMCAIHILYLTLYNEKRHMCNVVEVGAT